MSATESTPTAKSNGLSSKSAPTKGNQGPGLPEGAKGPTGLPSGGGRGDIDTSNGPSERPLREAPPQSTTTAGADGRGGPASQNPNSSGPASRDSFRFDFFGSNNSLSSLSAFPSFGSIPSLPSIPALLDPSKKGGPNVNEPAHRDVTVTATTSTSGAAGVTDNGRLVSPSPTGSPLSSSAGGPPPTQPPPHQLQAPPRPRPLPPLQPLPSSPQPQPTPQQSQPPTQQQPQPPAQPSSQSPQQQQNASGMNALVATQNQNRRIINPVSVPNGQNFVDITEYLNMPQSEAAKKLSIPPSTLSKRWKEAVRNRKWPWRVVCKLDKEIMTLLHNVPQGAPIPEEIEGRLGYLMRKRQEELKPVVIRL